jgi:hypothetical protein
MISKKWENRLDTFVSWVIFLLLFDVAVILTLLLVWGSWAIIHEMLK